MTFISHKCIYQSLDELDTQDVYWLEKQSKKYWIKFQREKKVDWVLKQILKSANNKKM